MYSIIKTIHVILYNNILLIYNHTRMIYYILHEFKLVMYYGIHNKIH
jgi:hypothetical protein